MASAIKHLAEAMQEESEKLHAAVSERCPVAQSMHLPALDLNDAADTLFALRKSSEALDNAKKQINKLLALAETVVCMAAIESGSPSIPRGENASASVRPTMSVKLPSRSKEPEKYAKLCELLGVADAEVTRLHFPSIQDRLSELLAQGKNLPKELEEFQSYVGNKVVTRAVS